MSTAIDQKETDEHVDETPAEPRSPVVPLIAGIVLAVVGIVAAGYGIFESFVTDLLAERAQSELDSDLTARFSEPTIIIDRSEYVAVMESQADVGASDAGDRSTVIDDNPGFEVDLTAFDDPNDVPTMLSRGDPTGLDPLVPDIDFPWLFETPPERGEAVGRIVIPQADVDWIFVEGVGVPDLRKGPGHMPGTALPGQLGNAVISGHRTTYGAPFFHIDALEPGDRFTVETAIGTHTYEVVGSRIVAPTDVWVTTQWEGAWLTLTSCNPRYSARERLIVFSKLVAGPNADSADAQYDGNYYLPTPPSA